MEAAFGLKIPFYVTSYNINHSIIKTNIVVTLRPLSDSIALQLFLLSLKTRVSFQQCASPKSCYNNVNQNVFGESAARSQQEIFQLK